MALTAQAEAVLTPETARRLVYFATRRTGLAVHDEDLIQEVLLRGVAAFRRTKVDWPYALFSKIVRDTVADHWRRESSSVPIDERDLNCIFDLEGALDRTRKLEQIRAAFDRLPAEDGAVMKMFYLEGLRIGEIAAIQRKSRSALKMVLMRARKKVIEAVTAGNTAAAAKKNYKEASTVAKAVRS